MTNRTSCETQQGAAGVALAGSLRFCTYDEWDFVCVQASAIHEEFLPEISREAK